MIGLGRRVVVGGVSLAAAFWLSMGGATGQVPPIPVPTDPGTVPAPPGEAPSVPAPPPPPTDTVPPGTPGAPSTPVTPAPAPTTTTVVPNANTGGAAIPPPRAIEGARPAAFGIDLSQIDALRRQARGKGPRAPQPDYGFDSALPFQPGSGTEAGGSSGEEALELGVEDEEIAKVRSAGAVAAGLMALLFVGIAVWVLRQARPALHPGRPGTGNSAPPPPNAARGGPGRRPLRPALYLSETPSKRVLRPRSPAG